MSNLEKYNLLKNIFILSEQTYIEIHSTAILMS